MPPHQGKFVGYFRVSTDRQGKSGLGLDAQRKSVQDYLDGGRWELVAEFTEVESGKRHRHSRRQRLRPTTVVETAGVAPPLRSCSCARLAELRRPHPAHHNWRPVEFVIVTELSIIRRERRQGGHDE